MNKSILGMVAVSMVLLLGVGAVSAFGFGKGLMNPDLSEEDRIEMQEQMSALRDAIETGDYATWEALMQEQLARMEDSINEDTFEDLVTRYEERQLLQEAMQESKGSGYFSKVETLREQFGEDLPRKVRGSFD